jgi:metal-responsive CopG/Arc/MetJ family transcriptional regulator
MRRTRVISVTIPVELAEQMKKLQKTKMKNYSCMVTEALSVYLSKEEYETQVFKMSESAGKRGIFSKGDVDKIVHEVKYSTH